MILFWYVVTLAFIAMIILISYYNNESKESKLVKVTIPDYNNCIVTHYMLHKLSGRKSIINTEDLKGCR